MLPVIWDPDALVDIEEIVDYIDQFNAAAAIKLRRLIEDAVERLPGHPYAHRAGRIAGTREAVVHPNYIIVYHVKIDSIDILSVLHTRQQYP